MSGSGGGGVPGWLWPAGAVVLAAVLVIAAREDRVAAQQDGGASIAGAGEEGVGVDRPGEVGAGPPVAGAEDAFDAFPLEHRPEAVRDALVEAEAWLRQEYPEANARLLGVDCAAPPCLMGMAYKASGLQRSGRFAGFDRAWQGRVEGNLGWSMQSVLLADGNDGRQHSWMFGLPEQASLQTAEGAELVEAATRRWEAIMDPLLDIEPAVPGRGEPGYVEPTPTP